MIYAKFMVETLYFNHRVFHEDMMFFHSQCSEYMYISNDQSVKRH